MKALQTDRLQLLALTNQNAADMHDLRSNEQVNVYLDRDPSKGIEDAQKQIDFLSGGVNEGKWFYWGLFIKGETRMIGTICLWNFNEERTQAEMGYELHPDFWQQGIMKEAAACILQFAKEELHLSTVTAITHNENAASQRLLQHFRFQRTQTPLLFTEEDLPPHLHLYFLEW